MRDRVRHLRNRRVHRGVPAERVQHAAQRAGLERPVREAMHFGVPSGAYVSCELAVKAGEKSNKSVGCFTRASAVVLCLKLKLNRTNRDSDLTVYAYVLLNTFYKCPNLNIPS